MQFAAVFGVCVVVAQCSALPAQNTAQPEQPPDYGALVANNVKTFKPFAGYTDFQISGLRWVQTETGWSWLVCLRYDDRGQRRFYSFFIRDNSVINARYDVLTDRCAAQPYTPFDPATGTIGAAPARSLQPLY